MAQVCHLEDLRALSLAGNNLRDLPRLLATYLRKLTDLNLACNALQRIPPVLALMPSLRHLDMSGNAALEVHPPSPFQRKERRTRPLAVLLH